ncbi:MAG: hypothetical protein H7315_11675 [Herminiimonas sp.]|nr:hypothetical protein [Herminiimonas sp.]
MEIGTRRQRKITIDSIPKFRESLKTNPYAYLHGFELAFSCGIPSIMRASLDASSMHGDIDPEFTQLVRDYSEDCDDEECVMICRSWIAKRAIEEIISRGK